MDEQTILQAFPLRLLIVSFISGLFLIFLTPLNLFLPPYIRSPFLNTSPTDTISSIIIIVVFSFFIGTPFYFLRDLIITNGGMNERLSAPFRALKTEILGSGIAEREVNTNEKESINDEELPHFSRWLQREDNLPYLNFLNSLNAEASIINGLLLASELTILFSLFFILSSKIIVMAFPIILAKIIANFTLVIINIGLNVFIFVLIWAYNKFYWNNHMTKLTKCISKEFLAFEKTQPKQNKV